MVFALTAAGEMLSVAQPFLEQQMHPTVIIRAFRQALEDILAVTKEKIRWVWPQPPAAVVILGPSPLQCSCGHNKRGPVEEDCWQFHWYQVCAQVVGALLVHVTVLRMSVNLFIFTILSISVLGLILPVNLPLLLSRLCLSRRMARWR